jgi:hypothetical protein
MTDRHHPGPSQRAELTEPDLVIAALVGRYVERREHHETPRVHDLLAAARGVRRNRGRCPAHRARLLRGDARLRHRAVANAPRPVGRPATQGGTP